MKSEPDTYSIDDLQAKTPAMWEGCRNFVVRNFMKDDMQKGDLALFYHSSCPVPGAVGVMEIVSTEAYPDPTQFDPKSDYYDPTSRQEKPKWYVVDVAFKSKFADVVTLATMRAAEGLENMINNKKGNRLSITPVTPEEWAVIMKLAGE